MLRTTRKMFETVVHKKVEVEILIGHKRTGKTEVRLKILTVLAEVDRGRDVT